MTPSLRHRAAQRSFGVDSKQLTVSIWERLSARGRGHREQLDRHDGGARSRLRRAAQVNPAIVYVSSRCPIAAPRVVGMAVRRPMAGSRTCGVFAGATRAHM